MNVTGTPGFRDGAFQSGCGMCKPSTDYTGGMPKRYFSPSAKLYKKKVGGNQGEKITSALNRTTSQQSKLKSISTQNGGGSDWAMSQRSRSLQPIEYQWTDMKDFKAFTKTPYISPKELVADIMPPSASPSTQPASAFDPMATPQATVGGAKKKKVSKKKTTKKKATKKKATKKKTTTKKKVTKKKVTKKKATKKVPVTKTKAYKAADKQEKKAKKEIKKLKKDLKKVEKKIKMAEKKKKEATKKRKKVAKK